MQHSGSRTPNLRLWWMAALVLVWCCVPLSAEGDDEAPADKPKVSSKSETHLDGESTTTLGLEWQDEGGESGTDWVSSNGGPTLANHSQASILWDVPGVDWYASGLGLDFKAKLRTDTQNDTSLTTASLVLDDLEGRLIASWLNSFKTGFGQNELGIQVGIGGGIDVLDLVDQDSDYLPVGADPGAFWYQLGAALDIQARLELKGPGYRFRLEDHYLSVWNLETAYDRPWVQFSENDLEASLGLRLGTMALSKKRDMTWDALVHGKVESDSNLVTPTLKSEFGLGTGLKLEKALGVTLDLLTWSWKAKVPAWDLDMAEDQLNQLSSSLSLDIPASGNSWQVVLQWPWTAWGATMDEPASGEWKLACRWSVQ